MPQGISYSQVIIVSSMGQNQVSFVLYTDGLLYVSLPCVSMQATVQWRRVTSSIRRTSRLVSKDWVLHLTSPPTEGGYHLLSIASYIHCMTSCGLRSFTEQPLAQYCISSQFIQVPSSWQEKLAYLVVTSFLWLLWHSHMRIKISSKITERFAHTYIRIRQKCGFI